MSEVIDDPNAWRVETPGHKGWNRTARPDDANKYFMVSADGHVQEPNDFLASRMDESVHHRLPGVTVDKQGNQLQKTEGFRPLRIKNVKFEGEDGLRNQSGKTPEDRIKDLARDGVDAEVLFPNKGLTI
ncbi:MAG: amidohydrolase, partial [bacterium]